MLTEHIHVKVLHPGRPEELPVPVAARRLSRGRRLLGAGESFLSSGSLSYERNFLFVRPAIAILVAAASLAQGPRFPGRDGVLLACSIAVGYNFLFAYFVRRERIYLLRATSLIFDNSLVLAASAFVFYRMGLVSYQTDLWLLFLVLIITNALYYGPIGALLFALLWTSWLVGVSLLFYDSDTYFAEQLPMRLVFFGMTTLVALSLCSELRKRREHLEQKTRETLTMLATIVEARDSDAGQHLRHIRHFSRALAIHLGLTERTANEIAYAAMIHDVGKAQVPDAVLKKPGPLTPAEREVMKMHSVWGDRLLAENEEFAMARQVARWHHERWDGSGYPDGLAGHEIPLAARIVAVADVYDALVSQRPYKPAWPPEDAIAELRRMQGSHLDAAIVDAFIDLHDSGVLSESNGQPLFKDEDRLAA